jgi:hypothetical protein
MSERKDYPPKFGRVDALWLGGLLLIILIGVLIALFA